jgi:hypothetical protein
MLELLELLEQPPMPATARTPALRTRAMKLGTTPADLDVAADAALERLIIA